MDSLFGSLIKEVSKIGRESKFHAYLGKGRGQIHMGAKNFFKFGGSKSFLLRGSKFLNKGAPNHKSKSVGGSDLKGGA